MKVSLRLNSGKVLLQKMMYDMNQYGATPRDRLDPRLFDQPADDASVRACLRLQ